LNRIKSSTRKGRSVGRKSKHQTKYAIKYEAKTKPIKNRSIVIILKIFSNTQKSAVAKLVNLAITGDKGVRGRKMFVSISVQVIDCVELANNEEMRRGIWRAMSICYFFSWDGLNSFYQKMCFLMLLPPLASPLAPPAAKSSSSASGAEG